MYAPPLRNRPRRLTLLPRFSFETRVKFVERLLNVTPIGQFKNRLSKLLESTAEIYKRSMNHIKAQQQKR
jgi:hypothetical protein